MELALAGFSVMLVLIVAGIPIALAMAMVGFAGFGWVVNWNAALSMIGTVAYDTGQNYTLSVVPLFILMGNFVARAGIASELYTASYAFLGHRRGGLAMATIVACAGFSAVCGSSIATTATMAKVSMPSMRRFHYDDSLASGSIAAGGTLGILIPPSVVLVIYGILTEQDIGRLFAAGILPGLLAVVLYLAAIKTQIQFNPSVGPPGERMNWAQRFEALRHVWAVTLLFAVVLGGIYGGVFTPTEAGGFGAAGAFILSLFRENFSLKGAFSVLVESVMTTANLFLVLIGALLFSNFINVTGLPQELSNLANRFDQTPILVVVCILGIYLILGCVLESMSMILLTVPVFYPLIGELGYDLIWFGILVVVATEISLITPPIGLNVFVLKGMLPDTSTSTIFKGVTSFWIADILRLSLLAGFPAIALFLPGLIY